MTAEPEDHVERRIVISYGRHYVYLAMYDPANNVVPEYEEVFRQPFRLERKDAIDETVDCWQNCYQWISETVVFPLPEGGGKTAESDNEEPPT
jgi:transposase-like protein